MRREQRNGSSQKRVIRIFSVRQGKWERVASLEAKGREYFKEPESQTPLSTHTLMASAEFLRKYKSPV